MTISLKADPSGNFGSILINGTEAIRVNPNGIPASSIGFTPSGNIAANNVQAALQEVDTETQAGLATKVSKSGDTMTGQLNGITPTAAANLTRKDYVDTKVSKAGDTMSGPLNIVGTLGGATPLTNLTLENTGNWNPGRGVGIDFKNNLSAGGSTFIGARVAAVQTGASGGGDNDLTFNVADNQALVEVARLTSTKELQIGPIGNTNGLVLSGASPGSPVAAEIKFKSDDSAWALDFKSGSTYQKRPMRIYENGATRIGGSGPYSNSPVNDVGLAVAPPIGSTQTQNIISVSTGDSMLSMRAYWESGVGQFSEIQSIAISSLEATRQLNIACGAFTQNTNLVTTAAGNTSDRRTKENIEAMDDGLGKILALRPVTFTFKQEYQHNRIGTQFGVIADEIAQVIPEVVHVDAAYAGDLGKDDPDPIKSVDYVSLVPVLVAAVQELSAKLDSAMVEIAALKAVK